MPFHPTVHTEDEWSAGGIPFCWLARMVSSYWSSTSGTVPAVIARAHPAGNDSSCVPRLVSRVSKDPSLEPVATFAISASAICTFHWSKTAQVLKHQDTSVVLLRKRNNVMANQMGNLFIKVPYPSPQSYVVLFAFRKDAGLAPVACNPSKPSLPK